MFRGPLIPISNRCDWVETLDLTEEEGGGIAVITAAKFRVRGQGVDLEQTMENGGITYDLATGHMVVTVPKEEMIKFKPGTYEVGCNVVVAGATIGVIASSSILVLEGVTS